MESRSGRKKILLAVDTSRQSLESVGYIARIFSPERVAVTLFMVLDDMPEAFWDVAKNRFDPFGLETIPFEQLARRRRRQADQFVQMACEVARVAGFSSPALSVDIHRRELGVARDILAETERESYRAVVLGRTGRSNLDDSIFGATAHKVIQQLDRVPIWTVGGSPDTDRILVALDFSKNAYRLVDYVGEMFAGSNRKITLFHATRELGFCLEQNENLFDPVHEEKWQQIIEDKARIVFDEALIRLIRGGIQRDLIDVKLVKNVISRAAAIISEARSGNYGTIFVGRKGLTQINRFTMGRVPSKVIQHARERAVCIVD